MVALFLQGVLLTGALCSVVTTLLHIRTALTPSLVIFLSCFFKDYKFFVRNSCQVTTENKSTSCWVFLLGIVYYQ